MLIAQAADTLLTMDGVRPHLLLQNEARGLLVSVPGHWKYKCSSNNGKASGRWTPNKRSHTAKWISVAEAERSIKASN